MYSSKDLSTFLSKAGQNSWKSNPPSDDSSVREIRYLFEEGDWKYEDSFFGRKPNGSREVVYYKGEPIWVMTSYGCLYDNEGVPPEEIYGFLRDAAMHTDQPSVKGSTHFEDSGYKYFNNRNGDLERFSGEEIVYREGKEVYTSVYSGGYLNSVDKEEDEDA